MVKFIRPYTLRKPTFVNTLINWIMLISYLKTSTRSLARNKLFSTINIFGLSISMSVGLLLIAFLTDLKSYDNFHVNRDRIYRVNTEYHNLDNKPMRLGSNSIKTGKRIQETVSGIEEVTILRRGFGGDAVYGEKRIPLSGMYATPSFFSVFSFPFIEGNPATALKNPNTIVLTNESANKIFGDESALGKTVMFDTIAYEVTGVLEDIPKFSHMRFESLVSFASFEARQTNPGMYKWESIWMNYVYVLLPEDGNEQNVQANLAQLAEEENKALEHSSVNLWLQPLGDIALGEDLNNQIGPTMMLPAVWIITALTFVVIISACFNYTNLSIARALRRSREVGVRKVIGAVKSNVMIQFLFEAVLISIMALSLSVGLFIILKPHFLSIAPELGEMVELALTPKIALLFILLAVVVGILAGFFPALFFSRINTVQALRNASSMKVFKKLTLRKALIVVQYTFSLMFIAATVIGVKQYRYLLSYDLGFNTENILNIGLEGNKPDIVAKELQEMPEVKAISRSLMVTSVGSYYGAKMKYKDPLDSMIIFYNNVDEAYFPLHGHKFIAGRNFQPRFADAKENEVIINEKTMKRFMIGDNDPQKALGEVIKIDGEPLTVIGVLKDFSYGKADSENPPVIFRYHPPGETDGYLNVQINSTDLPSTMSKIESVWKKVDKIHPLDATFYDEQIKRSYNEISAMVKLIGFLSFLAISIASLGLLGMVVFTAETRLREMSIRKVLGASEGNLIYLLSRGFLVMLLIAAVIALPATYVLFDQVVLSSMANRAPIGVLELIVSLGMVFGIAMLLIGSQTLKVARSNPATVLKSE